MDRGSGRGSASDLGKGSGMSWASMWARSTVCLLGLASGESLATCLAPGSGIWSAPGAHQDKGAAANRESQQEPSRRGGQGYASRVMLQSITGESGSHEHASGRKWDGNLTLSIPEEEWSSEVGRWGYQRLDHIVTHDGGRFRWEKSGLGCRGRRGPGGWIQSRGCGWYQAWTLGRGCRTQGIAWALKVKEITLSTRLELLVHVQA